MSDQNAPAETKVKSLPSVTIAIPVVFLPQGKLQGASSARVCGIGMNGLYDLHVDRKDSSGSYLARGIRHLNHPEHEENHVVLGKKGAWLTPKEYEDLRVEAINEARAKEVARQEAQQRNLEARIIKLADAGDNVTTIAAQCLVSEQLVEDTLSRHKKPLVPVPQPALQPPQPEPAVPLQT